MSWIAFALACAALGPEALHMALAAAAGTLLEAAPFLLAAEMLPPRFRLLMPLAGCGCSRRSPGAISLAATALAWLAFGPAVALGRFVAGIALLALSAHAGRTHAARRHAGSAYVTQWGPRHAGKPPITHAGAVPERNDTCAEPTGLARTDALAELRMLAPCAALAVLASSSLGAHASLLSASPPGKIAALALGLALGAIAPCATAAVAIAAALHSHLAPASAGILVTGGLVPNLLRPVLHRLVGNAGRPVHDPVHAPQTSANLSHRRLGRTFGTAADRIALAVVLALAAFGHAAGFVNPRLVPLLALGAALASYSAYRAFRRNRFAREIYGLHDGGGQNAIARSESFVPVVMLAALLAGSPVPKESANATELADAYPGERLTFTGRLHRSGADSILERFVITCCRADASPVAIRLQHEIALPDGVWIDASGFLEPSARGLILRTHDWHTITPPRDPFLYR